MRSPHTAAADRSYYWRVTAELHIDKRKVRRADGTEEPLLHRWATADAGYRELADVLGLERPVLIFQGPLQSNEMQLLNGAGRRLNVGTPPPPPSELVTPGDLHSVPDHYSAYQDTPLVVPAPGVLANDDPPPAATAVKIDDPSHGTVTLFQDGGFVYTPNPGVTGWDTFTYRVDSAGLQSATTTVRILVRPGGGPVWLKFHRYAYADWTPLAPLLLNW